MLCIGFGESVVDKVISAPLLLEQGSGTHERSGRCRPGTDEHAPIAAWESGVQSTGHKTFSEEDPASSGGVFRQIAHEHITSLTSNVLAID